MTRPDRRHVLLLVVVFAVALAGCTGGGGTPTATAADGASDGAATGDDDGGDGSDGAGDGGDGDDGSATATPAPTPTATSTATPTPTPNASGPTPTPLPRMSELIEFENSWRFSTELSTDEGTVLQNGRWYGTDFVNELTFDGRTLTIYNVDGRESYVVDGDCLPQDAPTRKDPGNWTAENDLRNVTVRPSGTTTVDGETVYVYEAETAPEGIDGPVTYYVSAETGYLRKIESADMTAELYDWGHDQPVESPC